MATLFYGGDTILYIYKNCLKAAVSLENTKNC